jgi:hypothetical protein
VVSSVCLPIFKILDELTVYFSFLSQVCPLSLSGQENKGNYSSLEISSHSQHDTFLFSRMKSETHIERHATWHDCMQLAGRHGKLRWNSVWWLKILCTGLNRVAKTGRKCPMNQPRTTPFICTFWVPICLKFNSQMFEKNVWCPTLNLAPITHDHSPITHDHSPITHDQAPIIKVFTAV